MHWFCFCATLAVFGAWIIYCLHVERIPIGTWLWKTYWVRRSDNPEGYWTLIGLHILTLVGGLVMLILLAFFKDRGQ